MIFPLEKYTGHLTNTVYATSRTLFSHVFRLEHHIILANHDALLFSFFLFMFDILTLDVDIIKKTYPINSFSDAVKSFEAGNIYCHETDIGIKIYKSKSLLIIFPLKITHQTLVPIKSLSTHYTQSYEPFLFHVISDLQVQVFDDIPDDRNSLNFIARFKASICNVNDSNNILFFYFVD